VETSVALLLELGLILFAFTVFGTMAHRFGLSPIPLYLLAGLALGEGGIVPVPAAGEFVQTGAAIGVVLLLLTLGLEFTVSEFSTSLRSHLPSAVADVALNATPGAVAGLLMGLSPIGVIALAGATYVSSSSIIARVLSDLNRLGNRETPAVLAVLVLEDFAMAAYLPLLAVLASGGTWWQALLGVGVAMAALCGAFGASYRWGSKFGSVVSHPSDEQLLLRVLAVTLVVAALAELVHASAAVGAFIVGLTLTGETAERARTVLSPLRDLFAALFFLAVGLAVPPAELVPMLPAAFALAVVTGVTKVIAGGYAARRDGVARKGQLRAGTVLMTRGEFSIVILGLAGTASSELGPLVTAYVFMLAVSGPVISRYVGATPAQPVAEVATT
jgi:CPA2 family monovalent cation:H+ antiporter-2